MNHHSQIAAPAAPAAALRGPGWRAGIAGEVFAILRELGQARGVLIAALIVLPYAGVMVGLDVASRYGALTNAPLPVQFLLSSDGGFSEWLEYSLTTTVAVMLFLLWRRGRDLAYLANAVLFVWLTLDNYMEFHEEFGHWAAPVIAPFNFLPVGANDVGEALLFLFIGLLWLSGLAMSIRHARFRPAVYSLLLAACVGGAAMFGVIVDMLVVWGQQTPAVHELMTFTEDGGEFVMIIVSFLVMCAIFENEGKRASAA